MPYTSFSEGKSILKIVSYRELSDKEKESILPIMRLAFSWPFNPQRFEEMAKIDPHYKNSPIGFCAVENSKVVSFIGVMDLKTKNLNNEIEAVGGIWGVATLPSHTRRGISTELMERAHEYFCERAYRFSFLLTANTIIAYQFYRKLGYKDATEFSSAQKVIKGRSMQRKEKNGKREINWDKKVTIYNKFAVNKTGFVIRDRKRFELLRKYYEINPGMVIESEKGYCIFKEDRDTIYPSTRILEIIALEDAEARNLIHSIEKRAVSVIYDSVILDKNVLNAYKKLGYLIETRSYDLLMVKELAKASFGEVYGEKFYMSLLDFF